MIIKQKLGESLLAYLKRFTEESIQVMDSDEKTIMAAFISGLQSGDLYTDIVKKPLVVIQEMLRHVHEHAKGES